MSEWLNYVKDYATKHNISYKVIIIIINKHYGMHHLHIKQEMK